MWNSLKGIFGMGSNDIKLIDLKDLSEQEIKKLIIQGRKNLIDKYKLNSKNRNLEWGKCGLRNLGNTCFMAAALQCMSNTETLTRYLLTENWSNNINPLITKSGGNLLCEYYLLLKKIWLEVEDYISPNGIKKTIVKVSSTFAGYSQQDSQEFLSYFMDVLMDDSNLVYIKPYKEKKDFDEKESILQFANKSWEYFKQRNISFIVDFFYGQFYTEITCPDCDKKSLTCDPYSMISLNIKEEDYTKFEGYILFQTYEKKIFHFEFLVSSKTILDNLIDYIFDFIQKDENLFLEKKNFIANFYRQSRIIKKVNNILNVTAKEIMEDRNLIFFIEDFNQENIDIVYDKVSIKNERFLNEEGFKLDIFLEEDDKFIGVERILQVHENTTIKDVYKWVFLIHRKVFHISEVCHSKYLETEFINANQLDNIIEIFFPNSQAGKGSLFYIKIENEIKYDLNSSEKIFRYGKKTIRIDIIMNKSQRQRTFKLKTCSNIMIPDLNIKNNELSLQSCFKHFVTKEKLDKDNTWYCNKCKDHKEAYIKHSLLRMPENLIIHLKRFKKTYYGNGYSSFRKINEYVDFEINNLDLSEFMIEKSENGALYDLYGVINHYGHSGGGHYTAFCRNFLDNRWYHFDDSDCSLISKSEILTKAAYVLFYKKRNK